LTDYQILLYKPSLR